MRLPSTNRRKLLTGAASLVGAALLGGCDRFPTTTIGRHALQAGEDASMFVQRLLLSPEQLAPEFAEADISPWFKPNGTMDPPDRAYKAMVRRKFADFALVVDGLVEKPQKLTLAELRKMPARTQITRHDCVEGWSCIGKWTGVPLRDILQMAGLKPNARFIVLHCADTMEGGEAASDDDTSDDAGSSNLVTGASKAKVVRYYESIDLIDAYHPQTILAYEMNGKTLPVEHGAPLRLRLERQLGYKNAKYVMRLEVVEDLKGFGDGKGGYWEDRGYDWYAGI